MRLSLVCNPTAQSGRGKLLWSSIESALRVAGISYEMRVSEYAGHAVVLARDAARRAETVVAVGGDGTINEVLCGLMTSGVDKPRMGVIYTGTSPDVCRYHKIPARDVTAAVALLARNNTVDVDVGRISYLKASNPARRLPVCEGDADVETSYFLCSVNLGVGARVATGANLGLRRYFGDFLGTLLSSIHAVLTYGGGDFEYFADNQMQRANNVLNLTVGKNPYIASGLRIPADIREHDGQLYLFVMNNLGRFRALAVLPKLYSGSITQDSRFAVQYLKEFQCDYVAEAPDVEFDGDHRGYLPCSISVAPRALRLVRNYG